MLPVLPPGQIRHPIRHHPTIPRHPVRTPTRHASTPVRSASTRRSNREDDPYDCNVTGWGWFHLISGLVVLAAAFNLFSGRTWARVVGIVVAMLSMLENFFFTPYYPVWSAIMIGLDVLIIWSLATYGHAQAHKVYGAPM